MFPPVIVRAMSVCSVAIRDWREDELGEWSNEVSDRAAKVSEIALCLVCPYRLKTSRQTRNRPTKPRPRLNLWTKSLRISRRWINPPTQCLIGHRRASSRWRGQAQQKETLSAKLFPSSQAKRSTLARVYTERGIARICWPAIRQMPI